jgi:calcium-dependent protein kinase
MLSSHPNVAALVGIYEDDKAVHLILELCQGGQLFDAVIALGTGYSERSAARFFRKMVEVVQHCHVLGIAHRDIKPENFLLSVPGPAGEIKAADFGLSQFFRSGRSFHSLVGSAYYVAPEVLTRNYGPKIDIWSLGVCCYIMLTGKVPFFGETEEEIFDMVLHAEVDFSPPTWPSSLSAAAKDIVRKMLQRDPAKRPTAAELLRHRWLCAAAPDTPLGNEVITRMISFAARTRVKRAAMLMATQKMATGSEENFKGSLNAPETPVQRAQSAEAAAAAAAASQSETLGTAGPSLSSKNRGLDSKDIASAAIDDIRDVTEPQPQPDTISRREAIVSADELVAKVVQDLSKVRGGSGMISLQDLQAELSHYGVSKEDYASLLRGMPVEDDGPRAVERLLKTLFAHSTDSLQEAARRRRFVEVTDEVLSGQRTALDEENEDAET